MKLKFLLLSLLSFFAMLSCNKSTTEPPEDPPGYQRDIPWPSLADSQWPMYRCDPQNTGRSKSLGAIIGVIEKMIDSLFAEPTPVTGFNNSLFILGVKENSGLYAFDQNGNFKWKQSSQIFFDYPTTPVLTCNGRIIYFAINSKSIFIVDSLGNIHKQIPVNGTMQQDQSLTINKDGTIFFLGIGGGGKNILYAFNQNGDMLWQKEGPFMDRMALSPDGSKIYIGGNLSTAFYSLDAATGSILWIFDKGRASDCPMVDCNGNIYSTGQEKSSGNWYFYSVNPDSTIRWKFDITSAGLNGSYILPGTIDRNGNIYFGFEKLISLDNSGNKNWEMTITDGVIYSPITSDKNNDIYFITYSVSGGNIRMLYKVSSSGKLLWKTNYPVSISTYPSYSPCIGNDKIILTTRGSKKLTIIK